MSLASDIIQAAYRELNLIPLGATPNANQTAEALDRLNSLVLSSIGFEAGDELRELVYGGEHDQSDQIDEYIEDNIRLALNLEAAATVYLDPNPYEGQRFAVVDTGRTLDTYNLTVDGNGRYVAGAATAVLSTEGLSRQYMYRADTGNWVVVSALAESDEMPFPEEFDDYFITTLAIRISPRYGQALPGETAMAMTRAKTRLRNRYRRTTWDTDTDPGLVAPTHVGNRFNSGRP